MSRRGEQPMVYSKETPKIWFKEIDGRSVFYPYGVLGKGYVIDDAGRARIERLLLVFLRVSSLVLVAALALVHTLTPFRATSAVGLFGVILPAIFIAAGSATLVYIVALSP